jgi:hypothetical protein
MIADMFRRNKPEREEVAQLDKRFTAAAAIADAGERLLAYADLRRDAGEVEQKLLKENAMLDPAIVLAAAAVIEIVTLAGVPGAVAALVICGLGGAGMAAVAWMGLVQEKDASIRKARHANARAGGAVAALTAEDPLSFANSPRFDAVMAEFPEIRANFVLAAARQSAQEPASPQPHAGRKPEQGAGK